MILKAERWLRDVFPGRESVVQEYAHLGGRELVIVAIAVFDSALSTLLTRRLTDLPKETESFLGLDDNDYAPCGLFAARIQLSLLTGILTPLDAYILRSVNEVRKRLTNSVKGGFTAPRVAPLLGRIVVGISVRHLEWHNAGFLRGNSIAHLVKGFDQKLLESDEKAGQSLVLLVLLLYRLHFHAIYDQVSRVGDLNLSFKPIGIPSQKITSDK
jgi:hypothetical protein